MGSVGSSKKVLSVFSLVMINVIAVDSLRTLPISAKLGLSVVSYYLVAALIFFIPVALVAAELATAYPKTGGIYIWVREAYGRRAAFITIWLQWIYNIVWYPTILAFIAAPIAYLFAPSLATNKYYLLGSVIGLFWLFTLLNCYGMKISSLVSTIGALIGTIVPIVAIIALGFFWLVQGYPIEASLKNSPWLPDMSSLSHLSLFSTVLFSLIGIEMSATHAEEVKNPQHDYPRALIYSTLIIFFTLVLGALAIVLVVPMNQLNLVSGLIEAYSIFFQTYHLAWMTPLIILCIIIGALSGVSTWIIGPTKGLLISAKDGCIPPLFAKVNKHGAPVNILIAQGLIVTALSSIYLLIDSINEAYLMLSVLSAQMALVVYVFMFAAAIKLRYTKPHQTGAYRISKGKAGMWLVAGIGLVCCLGTIFLGFIPPIQVHIHSKVLFELFLVLGLILFLWLPWVMAKKDHE